MHIYDLYGIFYMQKFILIYTQLIDTGKFCNDDYF